MFVGCFSKEEFEKHGLPMIHCYCFADIENYETEIDNKIKQFYGMIPVTRQIRMVRNIAPYVNMYCVSFRLCKDISVVKQTQTQNQKQKEKENIDIDNHNNDKNNTEKQNQKQYEKKDTQSIDEPPKTKKQKI